ncbi:Eco57I restriction-modification methylase domain-containing protein [Thalassospira xianhensis]|uniref:Eco57I restriction-modification methylase domain-containing protein n=1 Tax=Thalassospira xianhensis TaxID=478503 RepID=UPI000DED6539|nr:Eco57I restriction-modification methylase domain-containing protein [Thalassospira xianhensis]
MNVHALKGTRALARSAVFTNEAVVAKVLDVAGYTSDKDLTKRSVLEPSFGTGMFVKQVVDRLFDAVKVHGHNHEDLDISHCIRAYELDDDRCARFEAELISYLMAAHGLSEQHARKLTGAWLIHDDYLLSGSALEFDFVVGNPPYIRSEAIPSELDKTYRARFPTMFGRSDIYIPFIEHSLRQLSVNGVCCFICSDRWMKADYGRKLRALISNEFHVSACFDMSEEDAFSSSVGAYTAIIPIRRKTPIERGGGVPAATNDEAPWTTVSPAHLTLLRHLERSFECIENTGCKIGAGVATGYDECYIVPFPHASIETECILPVLDMGLKPSPSPSGLVNPFDEQGKLLDLGRFPKLQAHFVKYEAALKKRYIARRKPGEWYRTIDKVSLSLFHTPKLLIADVGKEPRIHIDDGQLYPTHNQYYLVSNEWPLEALKSILQEGLALIFIEAYSTKIRGGYWRYMASHLRRIRLPHWNTLGERERQGLMNLRALASQSEQGQIVQKVLKLDDEMLSTMRHIAARSRSGTAISSLK